MNRESKHPVNVQAVVEVALFGIALPVNKTIIVFVLLVGAVISSIIIAVATCTESRIRSKGVRSEPSAAALSVSSFLPLSVHDLLALPVEALSNVDIARMNLLAAKGLPGAESVDMDVVIRQLDDWADGVRAETDRHLYRVTDPRYADHYQRSEARLRAEMLVQVLQEDCGVHYNAERIRKVDFSNPNDLFIVGMIGHINGGTCASMPVLYVAIGRRLGYPMKLALAKQHVYCRWEGGAESFNIDGATEGGLDFPPDAEYRNWPEPISDEEMKRGEYLRGLTPTEELSLFMLNRGCVYHARGRFPEAVACFREAHRLMPTAMGPKAAVATALAGLPMPGQSGPDFQSPDVRAMRPCDRHRSANRGMPIPPNLDRFYPSGNSGQPETHKASEIKP